MKSCTIGLDFGTLSARGLAVDTQTGETVAQGVFAYPHGVMTDSLPDGTPLPGGFALSHPQDYLDALYTIISELGERAGERGFDVCGIGLDSTSPTPIPLDISGTPLALKAEFSSHPHAYIKLWKHHGDAGNWAKKLDKALEGTELLKNYGDSINCEFIIPKALETQTSDFAVCSACDVLCEVGDWLCRELTGVNAGSRIAAASNSLFYNGSYPDDSIFKELVPDREPLTRKLVKTKVNPGEPFGCLRKQAAEKLGLKEGIPVAPCLIDSHASVIGCAAGANGDLTAVFGTSACYMLNSSEYKTVPGSCSIAWEGNVPSLYGYESGQTCFGDGLEWVIKTCTPKEYSAEAESLGVSTHTLMQNKCSQYMPGGSGLKLLDWWNGVRSPLKRPELSAVISGITLKTKPEDIYFAAMESLCFGARRIVESYIEAGLAVNRLMAVGGIARKSPMLMQMLANVLNCDVFVCSSDQTGALGAAINAASIAENVPVTEKMLSMSAELCAVYSPEAYKAEAYKELYAEYISLSRIFENRP